MSGTVTATPASSPARLAPAVRRQGRRERQGRPWRLGGSARKAWLTVHIAAAGAWIGIVLVMGVFVFTALVTDDPQLAGLCYQTLEVFAVWPLAATGLICLGSGVVLGKGSKYGLVRYWWVAVKLVINLVLCTLVLLVLRPAVGEVAGYGRDIAAGATVAGLATNIFMPPLVSGAALLFATAISVFKPWGRIRRGVTEPVGDDGT